MILIVIIIILTLFLLASAFAANGEHRTIHVSYIYSPLCGICEHTEPVVRETMKDLKNSGVDIKYEEYSIQSKEGMDYMGHFGLDSVPAVIINDHAIRFEDMIGKNLNVTKVLKQSVEDALDDKTPDNEAKLDGSVKALPPQSQTYTDSMGVHMIKGQETPVPIKKKLSLVAVFLGGLVAGINPCLLAVLAFISAMALSMKGRRIYILFNLLAFCAGLLVIYLLVGIGFLGLVQHMPSISIILKVGIVILILAMAAFAFYEAYQVKKNPNRPSLFKSFLERYKPLYKKYSLIANFGLGGAFGLIKMPCVGGIYIAILGTIIDSGDTQRGLFYLAVYNLGVVLPVLALGALLVLGLSPAIIDAFRKRHRFNLKMATGLILTAMAAGFMMNIL